MAKQDVALTMSHSRQQPFRHFLYLCTTCFPEGQTVNLEAMLACLVSTSRMMETGYDKQELIWESDRMRYEERWVSKSGCDGRVCLLALSGFEVGWAEESKSIMNFGWWIVMWNLIGW